MTGPTQIQIVNRRTIAPRLGGVGVAFGGKFCNLPNGMYDILATVDVHKEGFEALVTASKPHPGSVIISIAPGVLCVGLRQSDNDDSTEEVPA